MATMNNWQTNLKGDSLTWLLLEVTAALVELGYGADPRLTNALKAILSKQDSQGRWRLENSLNGKMWVDIEQRGQPSKWVTLRALRVLSGVEPSKWKITARQPGLQQ